MFKFFDDNRKYILILSFALVMIYTFHHRMLNDDAFISFRYAKNLVEGNGLVWNIGERVEGYSNFSWVLLAALGLKLGIEPDIFTFLISIPIHLTALILIYMLAASVLRNCWYAMFVVLIVGFNHSVAGLTTSGLETPVQLLLFVASAWTMHLGFDKGWNFKRSISLSLLLNTAILTRPDSGLLIIVCIVGWIFTGGLKDKRNVIGVLTPFILITLPWLIWKLAYYGTILPNSYNAKVHGLSGLRFGWFYIYIFLIFYALIPHTAMILWRGKDLILSSRTSAFLLIFTATWLVYIIFIGGDFMEFRFMVPILPFIMILAVLATKAYIADKRIVAALLLALAIGTANNMSSFILQFFKYTVERVEDLKGHLYNVDENWIVVGHRFKELFGGTDVTLGIGAAGAIPYYSGLPCIDFMGLTDKEVPKIGEPFSSMPGHRIIAPLDYLAKRGANLIVQPIRLMFSDMELKYWMRTADWREIYRFFMDVEKPVNGEIITEAELIVIPIDQGYNLVVWYLVPNPEVDRVIREFNLRRVRVTRPRDIGQVYP